MTQEQLRNELLKFNEARDIATNVEYLDYFIQCYYDLVEVHHEDEVKSYPEASAKMILQMMFTKLTHLRKILEGVAYVNKEGKILLNPIIDPIIISCLVRNIYETVCMFNIVYDTPETEDEKKILYNLWVISGMNYRQRFSTLVTTKENKKKAEQEKKQIESYIKEIEETTLFKELDYKNQKKIISKIKEKDYKIKFDEKTTRFLTWQQISEEFITKYNIFEKIYTYFSLYAHPSYVSVFQYADMFLKDDEAFRRITVFHLQFCIALSSVFLADFVRMFPETQKTYKSRSEIEQIMLNYYNRFLRGDEKSISELWKKLG